MTTAARREPTFHGVGEGGTFGDSHHAGHAAHAAQSAARTSHFTRFVSGFQAISTLIGVPLALASGYTLYRTNFAPDATCSNLRAGIVQMLDKNVDAATRRMLVKRDVEAFEASCGAVDPDAHAAFRALLSADKPVAAKAPTTPKAEVAKAVPAPVAKDIVKEAAKEPVKTELRPAIVEKVEKAPAEKAPAEKAVAAAPQPAPAVADNAAPDATMSDARWLDAVRQALVDQPAEPKEIAREAAHPQPLVQNKPGEPVLQPAWSVAAPPPAMQGAASPLPPPVAVNHVARAPADPNRPVPPAPVPEAQYAHNGGNSGSWVAQIPFVGRMIDRSGE